MAAVAASRASWRPVGISLAGHILLLAVFAMNWSFWQARSGQPVRLAIEAAVVPDLDAVQEREREAERRRQEEAARRRAEEMRRQEEQRQAELARQEQERARQAEAERKRLEAERIAVEKRRAEEQRRREVEAKRAEEQRKAEAARRAEEQRKAAAEAKRRAEEQRQAEAARKRQQEREADLAAALAAEEAREDAVQGGLLDQWIEVIRQRVVRNWNRPPSAGVGVECEVAVTQIPGGDVVDVRVGRCNGDAAVVRSIENAVYRAAPLPPPPDMSLFERNITLIFKPDE